jgi:hypothetical protein
MTEPALVVDRRGLAKKLAHKPKVFILFELLQNALDEETLAIDVKAEMVPGKALCQISIEDDAPEGFADLQSVYTMFRDSKKASDPTKRGRFELGEKLVIALCQDLEVETTTGTVSIHGDTRTTSRKKRESGSKITLMVRMTREEFSEMDQQFRGVLLPSNKKVTYNGDPLPYREPLKVVDATLQTIVADEDGVLKPSVRKTTVAIHAVGPGETAFIYEMGIPVVETGDKFHYDVQQRVPVNWERSNVPPAYLKKLRVAALDAVSGLLTKEDAGQAWVQTSLDQANSGAVNDVLTQQFGEKRVIADPSDPEGTKIAMSQGYTVIPGGTFSRDTWGNIRNAGAALPAGKVTPSPKPYSDDPDAEIEKLVDEEKWTPGMRRIAHFVRHLGKELLKAEVDVRFSLTNNSFRAAFGRGTVLGVAGATFTFNYRRLGKAWFERPNRDEQLLALIIHEFGHYYSSDHLSWEFHDSLCNLGARLALLVLNDGTVLWDNTKHP